MPNSLELVINSEDGPECLFLGTNQMKILLTLDRGRSKASDVITAPSARTSPSRFAFAKVPRTASFSMEIWFPPVPWF